mgnify:CR=1 FL=1
MADDDDFKPKLGKIRSRGSKSGRKFLHKVLAASNLARGGGGGRSNFSGSRVSYTMRWRPKPMVKHFSNAPMVIGINSVSSSRRKTASNMKT